MELYDPWSWTLCISYSFTDLTQDLHFLLQDPPTPEGFQKASLKGSLKRSLKGCRMVLYGVSRGPLLKPFKTLQIDTEYDRANVPPYNGNDPPLVPGSLKRSLFPTLLNEVQNKGTQGVRARYGGELPPIISIVRYPGRPVISVPDQKPFRDPSETPSETPSESLSETLPGSGGPVAGHEKS